MSLTRREFVTATAAGFSLFSFATHAAPRSPSKTIAPYLGRLRHIHLELPAGPYTRAALAQTISSLADALELPTPEHITALGAPLYAETYPAEFALNVMYPGEVRLVIRASRTHTAPAELTLRGDRGFSNLPLTPNSPLLSC